MASRPAAGGLRVDRRRFLAAAGAASLAYTGSGVARAQETGPAADTSNVVPFYGRHQAGILTPAPAHLLFVAYDLLPEATAADLQALLQQWTAAAARLTQGEPVAGDLAGDAAAPGSAAGVAEPAGLTLTFGLGPRLFNRARALADQRPRALVPLPRFRREQLDPARCDGDLCVQACAEDPAVVFQAVRALTCGAAGVARPRWTQSAFGTPAAARAQNGTPRNLMGFKDGTANPLPGEPDFAQHVWVQPDDEPAWQRDGTFLVVRRIRMDLDRWEATPVSEQEQVIGRRKGSGAPLSGQAELDPVDPQAAGPDGRPLMPEHSHVQLAHAARAYGGRMLRRGYSYDNGWDPAANDGRGQADAGLFFMAFMRDPTIQFTLLQASLAMDDAMNRFITHVGSALFAIPPGVASGGYLAEALFA